RLWDGGWPPPRAAAPPARTAAASAGGRRRHADLLIVHAQERQGRTPAGLTLLPERDIDFRVAIVVAGDPPLEPERDERRRLGHEFARRGCPLRERRSRDGDRQHQ